MKLLLTILAISCLMASNGNQDDKGFKKYYQGYQQIMDGNWKQGITLLNDMVKEFPKSNYVDDAKYWTAYATQELGETDAAAALFQDCLKKYSSSKLADNARRNLSRLADKLAAKGNTKYSSYVSKISKNDVADTKNDDEELKESALFAISQNGGQKAADKLKSVALDKSNSRKIREKALFWYGQMSFVTAKDLRELFDTADSERFQEKVIFAISQKSEKEATQMLVEIFKNPTMNSNLREKALFWIGQSKPEYFEKYLADIMEATKGDDKLREKLMFNISQSRIKDKNDYLFKFAMDLNESSKVREKAIFWLGQSSGAFEQLKKLYSVVNEPKLQEKLIFSFGQLNTDESIDYLIKLLKIDSTPIPVKKKILFWLGQSKSKKAQNAILDMID